MSAATRAFGLRLCAAAALAACVAGAVGSASASSLPASRVIGEAPGGPGATSYLDRARKDCFGTARATASKVWFTWRSPRACDHPPLEHARRLQRIGGVRNVFFASVPLEAGKTAAFVTLPAISNGVGAITARHIFAVATGG